MFQKHLNQLEKTIQKNDLKSKILLFLLTMAILTDVCGSRVANVLFSNSDECYWNAYFLFQSLESFLFASSLFFIYKYYFYRPLKNHLFRWIIESWFAICSGDLLDNIFGDRYEANMFDYIALGCIVSSLLNILWIKFVNKE